MSGRLSAPARAVFRPAHVFGDVDVTAMTNGRFRANCYIVTHRGSGDCLVVDPGSDGEALEEHLASRGLVPQKIVLTHGHFDHVGAVDALMRRYGIPCEVHALEERLIRQAAAYAFRFAREPLRVPRGLTYVRERAEVDWNGRRIDVLPTPGHTTGSVALAFAGAFVFTGDTLFRERIGPTTYPESEPAAIGPSVAGLLATLPGDCTIFPGHGRPWSVGEARVWWAVAGADAPSRAIF